MLGMEMDMASYIRLDGRIPIWLFLFFLFPPNVLKLYYFLLMVTTSIDPWIELENYTLINDLFKLAFLFPT